MDVEVHACNPRQRQEDCHEFKHILEYTEVINL